MDKYVLHYYFYAIDKNDVDIILWYLWMELIYRVNINVKNKFTNFVYEKKKITLHDISFSKQEGSKGTHEKVSIRKIIVVPTNTSNEDPKVEWKEEHT